MLGLALALSLAAPPAAAPTTASDSPARIAWPGYAYAKQSVQVHGHPMRYVEAGDGDPIVLLHGIPTQGYLWRNVIPYLEPHGRVIAPDLMGYGDSYQGADIEYDGKHQQEYFDAFMDELELDDVVLVVNDLGSVLGLHWAARHPERVKGIVLAEAAMLSGQSFWSHLPLKMKLMFRMMRNERRAERFIVKKNMMVETMLPKIGVKRKLTDDELAVYRAAFAAPDVRRRVLVPLGPAAMPTKGRSADPWDAAGMMDSYAAWLRETETPKLLLWARPGLIASPSAVREAQASFRNLETVELPRGVHFLPEDHPEAIGEAVATFVRRLQTAAAVSVRESDS